MSIDEVMNLTAARIAELAREPVPFDVPKVVKPIVGLESDWNEAAALVGKERAMRSTQNHPGRLQRATVECLHDGAEEGERRLRLFRAAADMSELAISGGVDGLIHALLTVPGLDCGVKPSDVRRQIQSGIDHGRGRTAPREVLHDHELQDGGRALC